jgi:uncharacterized delta-60 repeat protein
MRHTNDSGEHNGSLAQTRRLDVIIISVFFFWTFVLIIGPVFIRAADGDLDASFGTGGRTLVDFAATDDYSQSIAVQPDGKLIVVGQSGIYPMFHSALVRFNANGSLDQAFGMSGKATAALDPNGEGLSAIALQPDGKIVVAGSQIHNNFTVGMLVARFNSDGSLDQAFGNGGSVLFNFGDMGSEGNAVVVQRDGKIIVAGETGASYGELVDIAVARFNPDGTFDMSYGIGGKVRTHFPGEYNTGSRAFSAALQLDDKLVVAGAYKTEAAPREFALARYNGDGSLDQGFGIGGMVHTTLGSAEAFAMDLAIQNDGKIVTAGYFYTGHHNHDFAVARYNSNGTLDTTFGANGCVISDLFGSSDDIAYTLAIQRDGKLIVAGRTGQYPNFRPGVVRYQTSGALDMSFGSGGKVMSDLGGSSSQLYGCAVLPSGRIVVAGYSISNNADMVIARYISRPLRNSSWTDID